MPQILFGLESDPHTQNDLAAIEIERVLAMEKQLLEWEYESIAVTELPDMMCEIVKLPVNVLGGVGAHLQVLESEGRGAVARD